MRKLDFINDFIDRHIVDTCGGVATSASALGAVYCLANGGADGWGWAFTFGVGAVLSGLYWRWARKHYDAAEAVSPVAEVDKVVARLDRQIAEARRNHKPRRHLIAAKHARINELLAGRAA